MMTSVGRFTRHTHGNGYATRITLTIDRSVTETHSAVACQGRGFSGQGVDVTPPAEIAARVTAVAVASWNQTDNAIPAFLRSDGGPSAEDA